MKWLERYPVLILTTVLCAVLSFCLADEAYALAIVAAGVVAVAFVLRERTPDTPPRALPKWTVNTMVLVAIIHAAMRSSASQSGHAVVSDLGQFLTFIQLIKLFDRRTPRDETQLLSLSLFLIIAAILTSNALVVGVLLVFYAPLLVSTAMLAQIRQGRLAAIGADVGAGAGSFSRLPSSTPLVRRPGRSADRQFVRLAASMTLRVALIATILFFITPRGLGRDVFGAVGQPRQTTIGYTDVVKLGQSGLLSESPTPVLDLRVTDEEDRNIGSPGRYFYLRGATRTTYNTSTHLWQSGSSPATIQEIDRATDLQRYNLRIVQHIQMRGRLKRDGPIFAVWCPVQYIDQTNSASLAGPSNSLQRNNRLPSYTVVSVPTYSQSNERLDPINAPNLPEVRESAVRALRSHRIDPGALLDEAPAIRQAANAVRDFLQSGFTYTTDLPPPPSDVDPLVWFLTTSRRGHCEYYASAMVTMLQSIGVHARLVTGYVAGEYNDLSGEYIVRESNAHAWVEVYLGDGQWQTYDPTPTAAFENQHQPTPTLVSRVRQWYDLLEFNWSSSIVGFDETKQSLMVTRWRELTADVPQVIAKLDHAGEWVLQRLRLERLGINLPPAILPLFPVLAIVGFLIYRLAGSLSKRLAGHAPPAPVLDPEMRGLLTQADFYQSALRSLSLARLPKPSSTSPLAYAQRLEQADASLARDFREVARAFYRLRFARRPLVPEELASARAAARNIHVRARALAEAERTPPRG